MELGGVVRLKSGGPNMTIIDVSGMTPNSLEVQFEEKEFFGTVTCRWFTINWEMRDAVFLADVLTEGANVANGT